MASSFRPPFWRRGLALGVLGLGLASLGLANPATAAPRLSPTDLALLNRVTWGARPADAEAMAAQGPDRWLDAQLRPDAPDTLPPAAQAQIDAMPISHASLAERVVDLE
ncbi:MAG: DUF1800 family protein, partial [Caulobacteraceae bacterium]|nr:DUF1800 family protein [Caulobacteraceae bacterium]